jgi:predicted dehydrogenase
VALADIFPDQLAATRKTFDALAQSRGYAAIDSSQLFVGPKAYEQIVSSKEVDAVLITTPPYFHPEHLEAAVQAGKHVYCEKPVAIDVAGAKRIIHIGERAQGRLSLDVGFQIRNAPPFVELVRRIQAGALGKIICGQGYYYTSAIERPEWPNASPAERRLRNWIYDRVLSGDILVEQNIHVIDIFNWVLQGHPLKAAGTGGRAGRADTGDVWGHFNVTFHYPDEDHITFTSTQFDRGWWDVNERFFGTKGVAESHYSGPVAIYGDDPWLWSEGSAAQSQGTGSFSTTGTFHDNLGRADAEKKKAFLESITSGNFHNQAAAGAESALSAILGRTAAYAGRDVTWEELLHSDEVWDAGLDLNKFV